MSTRIGFSLQSFSDSLPVGENVNALGDNTARDGGRFDHRFANYTQQSFPASYCIENREILTYDDADYTDMDKQEISPIAEVAEEQETPEMYEIDDEREILEIYQMLGAMLPSSGVGGQASKILEAASSVSISGSSGQRPLVANAKYVVDKLKKCKFLFKKGHDVTEIVHALMVYVEQVLDKFGKSEIFDNVVNMLQATKAGDKHVREKSFDNLIERLNTYLRQKD
ncbi:MAG: FAD-dependent thymidylate synthase [Puniceicoccales bacterium]|jgi:hypothetical protein|nr:FAD-dependent thymidylate synthase [Puniceicoccales bacterium]